MDLNLEIIDNLVKAAYKGREVAYRGLYNLE